MYEEPYRWIEAVGNRRQYLDEQFAKGSPVVALAYADGILVLTVSRGTPKLYEIYDRIALGGMGHPADLEKLRFSWRWPMSRGSIDRRPMSRAPGS